MSSADDLLDVLRAADPLATAGASGTDQMWLAAIRREVTARTATDTSAEPPAVQPKVTGPRRHVMRRRIGLAAAACAALVAGPIVVSGLPGGSSSGLVGVAYAGDGRLTCGQGYAQAIPPSEADLRLMPTYAPQGWHVGLVFARWQTGTTCFGTPSLTAARVAADGLVTGSVNVTGPVHGSIDLGSTQQVPDTVAGRSATRLVGDADSKGGVGRGAWVWTDAEGATWMMTIDGFSAADTDLLKTAVGTRGDQVTWDASAVPDDVQVLHRRTGQPYAARTATLEWYEYLTQRDVPLQQPDNEALAIFVSYDPSAGDVPTTAGLFPGERLETVGGVTVVTQDVSGKEHSLRPSPGLQISLLPGDSALTAAQSQRLLDSLTDVPADSPALRELALREKTQPHP